MTTLSPADFKALPRPVQLALQTIAGWPLAEPATTPKLSVVKAEVPHGPAAGDEAKSAHKGNVLDEARAVVSQSQAARRAAAEKVIQQAADKLLPRPPE